MSARAKCRCKAGRNGERAPEIAERRVRAPLGQMYAAAPGKGRAIGPRGAQHSKT